MDDCKLIITVRDGMVHFEGTDISLEDQAKIAGFLQTFVSAECLKNGLSMDDVKDYMLGIHLAAIAAAEELYQEGGPDGGKEEAD